MARNSSHLFMFVFLFLLRYIRSTPSDLCRLMEFDVKIKDFSLNFNDIEQRLFYRTDHFCQKKPVLRSLFYPNLYQFQAPNNRWWTLYQSNETQHIQIGSKQWCQAWNMKPILTLPLGIFQQAWTKAKHLQKWRRVFVHTKNQSYSYQSVSQIHLKCYSPSSKTSSCSTQKLAFLFDLTSSTNNDEFEQMKLWSKTLIWLLFNQTSIALSSYRDRFHMIQSFDHLNQSSNDHIEHLFDSIDTINRYPSNDRRIAVPWADAISHVLTRLFKRRFLLPIVVPKNITDSNLHLTNESSEEDIYTEPYPLFVNDDEAIKTVLNISNLPPERKKRSINSSYNPAENVLVILTVRSKSLFDYTRKEEKLSHLISDVPLRIVVIDFYANSNRRTAESHHSGFFDKAKYALASVPVRYNFIQTWLEIGDALHGYQLWDHQHRLCHPPIDIRHWNSTLVERTSRTIDSRSCLIIRLFETTSDKYLTLKDRLEFTFYRTIDQCFSAPVYRSLTDRNLYIQRISNGKWIVIRVDPLLPSTSIQQQRRSSTTTSTLPPEFFEDMDFDEEPAVFEPNNRTISNDLPTSVPHCSDQPGLELLFESDNYHSMNEISFPMTSGWTSHVNQSEIISPICNKYQISCRKMKFDLLVVVDSYREDGRLIENLLQTFLNLIEPNEHRFSLVILTSSNVDPFQYHLPLTSIEKLDVHSIDRYFIYLDDHNESVVPLVNHLERLSDYLMTQSLSEAQSIVLTISSRLNVDRSSMSNLIQRYSSIRYMAIDAQLKTDDEQYDPDRFRLFRSLVSQPVDENLFNSFAAHRDLTFNQIFQFIERLCGDLINFEQHDEHH